MKVAMRIRQELARRTDLCILPNEERMRLFVRETGRNKNTVLVWNCPALEEVSTFCERKKEEPLKVYYHGNLGPELLPLQTLNALAMLKEKIQFHIIGYETVGQIDYKKHFLEEAERMGIKEHIYFGDVKNHSELMKNISRHHVGLALFSNASENRNMKNLLGASNKVFDYMAGGMAVLVADNPDWKKVYVDPGYGLACNPADPESIARAFRWFLDHPAETRAMGEAGRHRILSEWNYEKQFQPVLELLEERVN